MWSKLIFAAILLAYGVNCAPPNIQPRAGCGYANCPEYDPDAFNVHLVAHSHDDVGWLKTVDQYYYGANNSIQNAGVQYIIDSVIPALLENPARRFIEVETSFFCQWWAEQSDEMRDIVKGLVENGQLEFTGGSWSMGDEAAAHYHSVIDQFTFGLGILNDVFGECGRPRVAWQIDPFGHSKAMGSMFAQMDLDGVLFWRFDFRDKEERQKTASMDMLWKTSDVLRNEDSYLFTSAFEGSYYPPDGFCFDILCADNPIVSDENNVLFNLEERVDTFAEYITNNSIHRPTNNLLLTMGGDFQFQNALVNFQNLDQLIEGFVRYNKTLADGTPIKVFYSTPACYVQAVNLGQTDAGLTVRLEDFFPHASDENSYWTGYYTSRPTSKRYERQADQILRIVKQLAAFNHDTTTSAKAIYDLESAVGIMQHHDAITGTEKQHVANDYARIVSLALTGAEEQIDILLSKLLIIDYTEETSLNLKNCILANISVCTESTSSDTFLVAVYNPLSRPVTTYVRLPVTADGFTITNANDSNVQIIYDIIPAIRNFSSQGPAYDHAENDLVFIAEDIPAMGVKLFQVSSGTYSKAQEGDGWNFGNKDTTGFAISLATRFLTSVTINGNNLPLTQNLLYYVGAVGDNNPSSNRSSGAYIFRPDPDYPNAIKIVGGFPTITTFYGNLVDEVRQQFSSWATQIIRVYKDGSSNHIEFDWVIGPIDVSDDVPKEIISRFTTQLTTNDIFYTDSNGREMVKRVRDFRSTFVLNNTEEPVASNYYPVTSRISIMDEEAGVDFSILTDRAQGGTSLNNGELELMLHRRLLHDDDFGVGEVLDEVQYGEGLWARGTHYLTVTGGEFASLESSKRLEQEKAMATWTFVSNNYAEAGDLLSEWSGISGTIPDNLQVLTLQPHIYIDGTYLMRLENIYEAELMNTSVNIQALFNGIDVTTCKETTLAANQYLENRENFEWKTVSVMGSGANINAADSSKSEREVQPRGDFDIELNPKEIRTFILNIPEPVSTSNAKCISLTFSLIIFVAGIYKILLN